MKNMTHKNVNWNQFNQKDQKKQGQLEVANEPGET